jgi:hypothetical protein
MFTKNVGQGFSLAFKIPLFVSPFGKGGLEGDFHYSKF